MIQLSAGLRQSIRRFRGLLLTGVALALGTALGTEEAQAQFLGQDFTSGTAQSATATGASSTAVGSTSNAAGTGATALGSSADAQGAGATAVGLGSEAIGEKATSLGSSANAIGFNATALGYVANAAFNNSTALGYNAVTTRDFQMKFGEQDNTYTMRGITSAGSLAVQSGSGQFVTSDATGNLVVSNVNTSRVGFGTFSPDANSRMDIRSSTLLNGLLAVRSDAGAHFLRVETSTGIFRSGVQGNGDAQFGAMTTGKGLNLLAGGTTKILVNSAGQISFGNAPTTISSHALLHSSGANLTLAGVWTNASSRTLKQDIEPISSEQARDTVRALQPVGYRYKNEPDEKYVGFIAEDVPELVATNDRKGLAPMDITAVLTKVVQDQDRRHDEQERTIARLEQTNAEQKQLLDSLSKRLAELERKSERVE